MGGISPRRYPSPLRYPGGKGKIANYVKLLILKNNLVGYEYAEPFAGGASIALSLLFEEYVSHIHINDVDPALSAFWRVTLERPGELSVRIDRVKVTMSEWRNQREIQLNRASADELDLAFSTFFLNRTNRSGIILGGPIGGSQQRGPWRLDARFNKSELIRRINKISRFAKRISLTQMDGQDFLTQWTERTADALLYLDPPYFAKGADLYTNYYRESDHESLASMIPNVSVPWIVTYDAVPEIMSLYRDYRRVQYTLAYSAADRYRGSEALFLSPELRPPAVSTPTNIPVGVVDALRRKSLA